MQNKGDRTDSLLFILHFVYDRLTEACQYAEIECPSSEYRKHVIGPLSAMLWDTEKKIDDTEGGEKGTEWIDMTDILYQRMKPRKRWTKTSEITVDLSNAEDKEYVLQLLVSLGKHLLKIINMFEDYANEVDEDDPDNDLESFEICSELILETKNFIIDQFSELVDEFGDFSHAKLGTVDVTDSDAWNKYLTKTLDLYVTTYSK